MLGGAGHSLECDAVRPGGQQPLTPARRQQERPFAVGEVEGLGQSIDGLRRLTEQDLGRGVGDHRLAEVRAEEVAGVLGHHGQGGPLVVSRL